MTQETYDQNKRQIYLKNTNRSRRFRTLGLITYLVVIFLAIFFDMAYYLILTLLVIGVCFSTVSRLVLRCPRCGKYINGDPYKALHCQKCGFLLKE